jgi:hypothetical protein
LRTMEWMTDALNNNRRHHGIWKVDRSCTRLWTVSGVLGAVLCIKAVRPNVGKDAVI